MLISLLLMYKEKRHVLYWNTFSGKQQLNYKYVFGKALCGGGPSAGEV